jgi:protein-arginine kinase activator protein McsA
MEPIILHIELGSYPIASWLKNNKYVIFSELVRYVKNVVENDLEVLQSIMVSNNGDNIVFILRKENIENTLEKAMEFFTKTEEYEKCAEIRDLNILIEKLKSNESKDFKNSKPNKRKSKSN